MASAKRTLDITMRANDKLSGALRQQRSGLERYKRAYERLASPIRKVNSFLRSTRGLVLGVGAALAVYAGARGFTALINKADQLGKLANSVGDSVENVSRLDFALERSGFAAGSAERFYRSLGTTLFQMAKGTKDQREAFQELGLTVEELALMRPQEIFASIAKSIEGLSRGRQQNVLKAIFPRDFQKVINLLGDGEKAFRSVLREADKFGAVVSSREAHRAAAFADAMTNLKSALEGVGRALATAAGTKLVGIINKVAEVLARNEGAIVTFFEDLTVGALKFFDKLVRAGIEVIAFFEDFGNNLKKAFSFSIDLGFLGKSDVNLLGIPSPESSREFSNALLAEYERIRAKLIELSKEGDQTSNSLALPRIDESVFGSPGSSSEVERSTSLLGIAKDYAISLYDGAKAFVAQVAEAARVEAILRRMRNLGGGFRQGLIESAEAWANMFEIARSGANELVDSGLTQISTQLAGIISQNDRGKQSWREWGRVAFDILSQLIIKLAIAKALQAGFSSFFGGGDGGGTSLGLEAVPQASQARLGGSRLRGATLGGGAGQTGRGQTRGAIGGNRLGNLTVNLQLNDARARDAAETQRIREAATQGVKDALIGGDREMMTLVQTVARRR